MQKVINQRKLSDTLTLSECRDGFWLYDDTRGMNLSMRAESTEHALLEALKYYQERLTELKKEHREMSAHVQDFINKFRDENEEETGK